jgi:hypothetical protein
VSDYPVPELVAKAQAVLDEYQAKRVEAKVYFKATCPTCGERPCFTEPNIVFEEMECCECGTVFPFTKGGFLVEFKPNPK